MNILTLTNCPLDATLGSGKTVINFSDGLRRLGHEVDILAPERYELWPRFGRAKQLRQGFGAIAAVASAMRERRYDVLEFYGAEFWPVILRLSRASPRPLLVAHTNGLEVLHYERERQFGQPRGLKTSLARVVHEPLLRLSFARTDRLVALSEEDRVYAIAKRLYAPGMTAVVEPGLDGEYRRAIGQPLDRARSDSVCFTGSWLPRKATSVIVAAMTRVLHGHAASRFEIFGAAGDAARITQSFPAGLRRRIIVHPVLKAAEMATRLRSAKVFLFPSEYEGFGLALAEAMACGLAAVITPTGFGASLKPGSEALVCGFGDVDCVVQAVLRLLSDEPLRTRLAANGQERVASLTWASSASRLESVYLHWLTETRSISTNTHVDRA